MIRGFFILVLFSSIYGRLKEEPILDIVKVKRMGGYAMTLSKKAINTLNRMIAEGFLYESEIEDQGEAVLEELKDGGYITNNFEESYPVVEMDISKVGSYFTKRKGYDYLRSKYSPNGRCPNCGSNNIDCSRIMPEIGSSLTSINRIRPRYVCKECGKELLDVNTDKSID